jgi:hypothetical protein
MSTTNGHATIQCERCDRNGFQTPEELRRHLTDPRDGHAMDYDRASSIALKSFGVELAPSKAPKAKTSARSEVPPDVLPPDTTNAPHHVCPKCETRIPCMWETIAQVEQQATRLKMLAAQMRHKQMGTGWGAPRKDASWTDADVLTAYSSGLSIRAIARMYGAGTPTIDKALKRVGAKG